MKLLTIGGIVLIALLVLVVYERCTAPPARDLPAAVQVQLDSMKSNAKRSQVLQDSLQGVASAAKSAEAAAAGRAQAASERAAHWKTRADSLAAEGFRLDEVRISPADTAALLRQADSAVAVWHEAYTVRTREAEEEHLRGEAKDQQIATLGLQLRAITLARDAAQKDVHDLTRLNGELKDALTAKGRCHIIPHLVGCPTRVETGAIGAVVGVLGALALSR